jgi:hypothetical protein
MEPLSLKRPGVVYAPTLDGMELPVIDITHPAFALPENDDFGDSLRAEYLRTEKRLFLPSFVLRFLLRRATKRSILARALDKPDAAFLSGLKTYVMKLGPCNLGPSFNDVDRHIAGSPPFTSMRLRLQQIATLTADALEGPLTSEPDRPLHLVNIGGGPAIDSINALLRLRKRRPQLLERLVVIHVLDLDEAGPAFGKSALHALMEPGNPLYGKEITFLHRRYDWKQTEPLEALAQELSSDGVLVAATSEGALFEYADDYTVLANLRALRNIGSSLKIVACSVTRADATTNKMMAGSKFKLVPRGETGVAILAGAAGFKVVRVLTALTSDQVALN